MSKSDGGAAFPRLERVESWKHRTPPEEPDVFYHTEPGMSLRDYFAAAALAYPGVHEHARKGSGYWAEWVAYHAYQIADAMLAEREKEAK